MSLNTRIAQWFARYACASTGHLGNQPPLA